MTRGYWTCFRELMGSREEHAVRGNSKMHHQSRENKELQLVISCECTAPGAQAHENALPLKDHLPLPLPVSRLTESQCWEIQGSHPEVCTCPLIRANLGEKQCKIFGLVRHYICLLLSPYTGPNHWTLCYFIYLFNKSYNYVLLFLCSRWWL